MRAAEIEKELDAIREIQGEANGENNPTIISALLAKFAHPEAAVRKAALEALKELNDTNAVPGLQQVADLTKDPREKVAVLDTIDYLNLPSIMADAPADYPTNNTAVANIPRNLNMNPKFLHKARRNARPMDGASIQSHHPRQQPSPLVRTKPSPPRLRRMYPSPRDQVGNASGDL